MILICAFMKINRLGYILYFVSGLVQSPHAVSFHSSRNEWSSIKSGELDFTALFIVCSVILHLLFLLLSLNELFPIIEQLLEL